MQRRILVTTLLSASGAAVGAMAAPVLSVLATAVAQASLPVGRVAYYFDPAEFAVIGAIGLPILAWLLMRRVPLWRAICEPAIGGALGLLAALAAIPFFNPQLIVQPLLVLIGILGAALRLRHAHRSASRTDEAVVVGDHSPAS